MRLTTFVAGLFFCLAFNASAKSNGGTWLDATRIIYKQSDSSRAVKITNTSADIPYLVRAWVTPVDSNDVATYWAVTPPVYRLNEKEAVQLKINALNVSGLPKDKESVFYLNALSIPGSPSAQSKSVDDALGGKIVIALNTKIKLFYRPAALENIDVLLEYKKLRFTVNGKTVSIKNPTPFSMNFGEIKINGVNHEIPRQMIAPFSSVDISTPSIPEKLTYRLINDFGGETAATTINLKG